MTICVVFTFGCYENDAIIICVEVYMWKYVFNYIGNISRSGIPGSYGTYMFNILKKCQTVLQSTILYSTAV